MSQVVQTIVSQLQAIGVSLRGATLVKMDENTLRVNRGMKNVDIRYNAASDLYDCKIHKINRKTFDVKTEEFDGMYVDCLPNLF